MTHAHTLKDNRTLFGFWLYLMSDCLIFASLFATYAVLRSATYGAPGARELFSLEFVFLETVILLSSSFTMGLTVYFAHKGKRALMFGLLALTFCLGTAFIALEVSEFSHLIQEGLSWERSAFLSAFFTLVGTHGLHVLCGLIWMIVLAIQLALPRYHEIVMRRLICLSLFWHFLDIIWIGIFTFVYLFSFIV
ncbi:cytochrome o ubiquinol oxidase subunit III [bacterium]|nr:cytochrome o ubiquinol oxidase subunit III [bacterium]